MAAVLTSFLTWLHAHILIADATHYRSGRIDYAYVKSTRDFIHPLRELLLA